MLQVLSGTSGKRKMYIILKKIKIIEKPQPRTPSTSSRSGEDLRTLIMQIFHVQLMAMEHTAKDSYNEINRFIAVWRLVGRRLSDGILFYYTSPKKILLPSV